MTMKWVVRNRQRQWKVNWKPFLNILDEIAHSLQVPPQTCTIMLVRNRVIQALKKEFLAVNEPTDVLSFPIHDTFPDGERYLGDIVISVDKVLEQAKVQGIAPERELAILLIHGFLHLLGYDHERDQGEMEQLEKELHQQFLNEHPFNLTQSEVKHG